MEKINFEIMGQEKKRSLLQDVLDKRHGDLDVDWSELCEKYGLEINPDTLRKASVGILLVEDAGMLNDPPDEQALKDLYDRNYIERAKLRDLRNQINALQRQEARSQMIRETIREAISSLPELKGREPDKDADKILYMHPPLDDDPGRELVVALGDMHFGAEFEIRGLHGEIVNEYNPLVLEERLHLLLEEIVKISLSTQTGTIHLCLVGDLLDGMLRQSQLMKLRYGVVESTMRLAEILAQFISDLAACCEEVVVHAVTGNHSEIRPLGSNKGDFEDENLEKVILWYLEERLNHEDNVMVFGDCEKMSLVEICGFNFLLLHGDNPKDIANISRDAVNLYGEKIDYYLCGHLHKESEFLGGMTPDGNSVIIRVPSLCGSDRYAQNKFFGGKAGATVMLMEEGYGRRCVFPIVLQENQTEGTKVWQTENSQSRWK